MHVDQIGKENQVFLTAIWLILLDIQLENWDKINNSFQILDDSQSRSGIPVKRGEKSGEPYSCFTSHTLEAVSRMQGRKGERQQSLAVSDNWGDKRLAMFREAKAARTCVKAYQREGTCIHRTLEICRGLPSSLWQVIYDRKLPKVGERTHEKQIGQRIPETHTRVGRVLFPPSRAKRPHNTWVIK